MNNKKHKIKNKLYIFILCFCNFTYNFAFIYSSTFNLDVYNLIMKSINKVIKTIIFLQFKKSQFLFSEKGLLHFFRIIFNFFFYKTFDIPLT